MKKIILILITILTLNIMATPLENISQKFSYIQHAANGGNAQAQFDLGLMYAKGEEIKKDEREAFSWFHKAARNNNVEAKFYMGLSFAQGRGVRKEAHLARYWFKLAVKAGHKQAIAYMAMVEKKSHAQYTKGERVSVNNY